MTSSPRKRRPQKSSPADHALTKFSMPSTGLDCSERSCARHSHPHVDAAYAMKKVPKLLQCQPPMAKAGTSTKIAMPNIQGICTAVFERT